MFQPQSSTKIIDPRECKVYSLLTSINQPTVAFAEEAAAPTFAFIFGVWTADESALECYVMLYQPKKDIGLFYHHENGGVSEEEYPMLEAEAIQFTDSMGFMMDNLNYADQSQVTQLEMVHNFPPFMPNRKLYQAARVPLTAGTKTTFNDFVELDADADVVYHGEPEPAGSAKNLTDLSPLAKLLAAF